MTKEKTIDILLQILIFALAGMIWGYIALAWAKADDFKGIEILDEASVSEMVMIQQNSLKGMAPLFIQAEPKFQILATITGYTPSPAETDETPEITASGKKVREGIIACPKWLDFGTEIEIDNERYVCEDRLNPKFEGRFDILFFDREEAKNFGCQIKEVKIY